MTLTFDPYDTLGTQSTATGDEIRAAQRLPMRRLHCFTVEAPPVATGPRRCNLPRSLSRAMADDG